MASISDIEIKQELRPCLANGKKALFHKWIEHKDMLNNKYSAGLVEFEDGTLNELSYIKIKFVDNKIKEYTFDEGNHIPTVDFNIDDNDLPF